MVNVADMVFTPTGGVKSVHRQFDGEVADNAPYSVVYTDPPWPDKRRARESGSADAPGTLDDTLQRTGVITPSSPVAPPNESMRLREIMALPVSSIMKANAILVMWTPWSRLDSAMAVIRAWGFEYSSGMPWLKIDGGGKPVFVTGSWFRNCTEMLLVGRRGNTNELFKNANMARVARDGLLVAEKASDNQKPDEAAQWITASMPGPYVELFARKPREGWICWGENLPSPEEEREEEGEKSKGVKAKKKGEPKK